MNSAQGHIVVSDQTCSAGQLSDSGSRQSFDCVGGDGRSEAPRAAGAVPYPSGALFLNCLTRTLQKAPAAISKMSVLQGAQVQWET